MARSGDAGMNDRWQDAVTAAKLLAIDPVGLGGVILRSQPGAVRDQWLSLLKRLLPHERPVRRVPLHAGLDRLLGGLDLGATLSAGKPVMETGLLASADRGLLVLAMAERLPEATAAIVASAIDQGSIHLEREGFASRDAARVGVIALDESLEDEDRPSDALRDRLAFEIDFSTLSHRDLHRDEFGAEEVAAARSRLGDVHLDDAHLEGLTTAALALGIGSLRAPLLAIRAALASAALYGRTSVVEEDTTRSARLVLAHRATRLPMEEPEDSDETDEQPEPQDQNGRDDEGDSELSDRPLEDRLLAAAIAALPPGLLDALRSGRPPRGKGASSGRAGPKKSGGQRGRPAGIRPGKLDRGERLSVIDTLRAAAPWQPLRRNAHGARPKKRLHIRPSDFRTIRRKEPDRTTTIFAVDASGSSALQRLGEAKGAVELLLAECYTRRDQVALLAFRGDGADVLLTPTRSLVRAKRSLAAIPGGGGTPLASGVQTAFQMADAVCRRGETPLLVFLTDGRGNIALDGTRGRLRAMAESEMMARQIALKGHASLVIDISARPGGEAEKLANALGARYLPLPRADAKALSDMVIAARDR